MARIRTIKPELTLDEELAKLSIPDRYFFINLWCHCDRSGRTEDRPQKLKALIFPWDDFDIDGALTRLHPKFVLRYEVDGRRYLQVIAFEKHQRPHVKEAESDIPALPKSCLHEKNSASTLDKGKGMDNGNGERILDTGEREGKGKDNGDGKGSETGQRIAFCSYYDKGQGNCPKKALKGRFCEYHAIKVMDLSEARNIRKKTNV